MKLSLVERETILLYNQAEPMAEVYTHDPRLMEKLELLAKKHPGWKALEDAYRAKMKDAEPKKEGAEKALPEQLQSPLLTAEWDYRLGEIERGQLAPEEFLDGICAMLKDLVGTYQVIKGTEYLFTPPREVVGKCPRCGGEVADCKKASSVRMILANLQSGKITNGGLPRKNSRPRLWCLRC